MQFDYFAILGVERGATPEEIRQAYRQKALLLHPDVNQAPDASERFQALAEAYRILSDDTLRERYLLSQELAPFLAKPKQRKRRSKKGANLFYGNMLVIAFVILWFAYARGQFVFAFVQSANPTDCKVVSWESRGNSYRLHYEADVPWRTIPFNAYRTFYSLNDNFQPGQDFECYYNAELRATQISHYDYREIAIVVFWSIVGVLIFGRSILHFSL
jgi:curved DNA-binding protein CbpA